MLFLGLFLRSEIALACTHVGPRYLFDLLLALMTDFLLFTFRDGEVTHCSWGVLENYEKMGADYFEKNAAVRKIYYPIELDLSIPISKELTC